MSSRMKRLQVGDLVTAEARIVFSAEDVQDGNKEAQPQTMLVSYFGVLLDLLGNFCVTFAAILQ